MKKVLPFLLVLMLLCGCNAKDRKGVWEQAYSETGAYLQAQPAPSVGSVGGEWMVLGLSRAGLLSDAAIKNYEREAETYVAQASSVRLHRVKSTENSRLILGLTAVGHSAADVGGINLLAGLTDMNYLRAQGLNGPIWALIALDSGGYDIPQAQQGEEQVTRKSLVQEILGAVCSDGGWALMGDVSDVDMTAMALTALAPYREEPEVKTAIEKALEVLSAAQLNDGGFKSWGTKNSESCAQVIVAMTALGIDPANDSRFLKNGVSPLDSLCSFACDGGGFRHTEEQTEPDGMATEQGFYALVAYRRFTAGMTGLYDMSDAFTH